MTEVVERSVPFTRSEGNGHQLSGYAAVFNMPTTIRGEGPDFVETIARGAFTESLKQRTPVLMYDHGHSVTGSVPIGVIQSAVEDERGLFIKATLHDNQLVEPVRQAIESGALSDMSFRFEVLDDVWDARRENREVRKVSLLELGPVAFGAYQETSMQLRGETPMESLTAGQRASYLRGLELELMRAVPTKVPGSSSSGPAPSDGADPNDPAAGQPTDPAQVIADSVDKIVGELQSIADALDSMGN